MTRVEPVAEAVEAERAEKQAPAGQRPAEGVEVMPMMRMNLIPMIYPALTNSCLKRQVLFSVPWVCLHIWNGYILYFNCENISNVVLQLLELLDTLHTSAGSVMAGADSSTPTAPTSLPPAPPPSTETPPLDWSSGSGLWQEVLCPLLQGIARYCCDSRQRLRHLAMTCLQRALLSQDLHTLSAAQWESCFNKVGTHPFLCLKIIAFCA